MVLIVPALWNTLRALIIARSAARRIANQDADHDAADLIRRHGDLAYGLARQLAREQRTTGLGNDMFPADHWDNVRRRIAVLTGREITADGVRYSRPVSGSSRRR